MDGVKSEEDIERVAAHPNIVIPAQAGIHPDIIADRGIDSRLRGNDVYSRMCLYILSATLAAFTHSLTMPSWLVFSLIASIFLTIGANVLLRLYPGIGRSAERRFLEQAQRSAAGRRPVRILFPWKTMLVVSLLGTVALNLLL